jgi:hypothetical protein
MTNEAAIFVYKYKPHHAQVMLVNFYDMCARDGVQMGVQGREVAGKGEQRNPSSPNWMESTTASSSALWPWLGKTAWISALVAGERDTGPGAALAHSGAPLHSTSWTGISLGRDNSSIGEEMEWGGVMHVIRNISMCF